MKKLLEFMKKNIVWILLPIIFLSFFLIHRNAVYFGDDFYYLSYTKLSLGEYFSELSEHYQKINGRFLVHLLATFFLKLPMPFWQIFNSALLTGICYFASQIITQKKKENQPFVMSLFFFLIAGLAITITRQSVYWITGSFNYVYPLFCFFTYWYCLQNINSFKYFAPAILLGFLASASVEQAGMMTFGLTLLTFLSHFTGFKQIKDIVHSHFKEFILVIVTLIGVSSVLFAPSQWVRLEEEETSRSTSEIVVGNAKYLLFQFSSEPNALPFITLLDLAFLGFAIQKRKTRPTQLLLASTIFNFLFAVINIYGIDASYYFTPTRILLILGILLTYSINFFLLNCELQFKIISPLTIPIILMLGSQFMMVISPVLGPRNLISGFLLFAYLIGFVANQLEMKYHWITTSILSLLAIILNLKTMCGYAGTRQMEEKNLQILKENQSILQEQSQEITLYRFPDDNYGWSMPYLNSYHEYWFKKNYQIQCKIHWE